MAKRNIVQDGDKVLKTVCRPVVKFNDRLGVLLDDMVETMLDVDGVGLAGPQVGVVRRVFVAVDVPPPKEEEGEEVSGAEGAEPEETEPPRILEFINPEIIEQDGEVMAYEGCLSFPGQYGAIKRPQRVKVRALDRHGKPFELEAAGMLARCICHETNHLDGITIDDLAEYFYDPDEEDEGEE
jgi:peptide deformylase